MDIHKLTKLSLELLEKRKHLGNLKYNHMCVIITKKGIPLSYGYNDYDYKNNITEHAEEMAIRKYINKINLLKTYKKKIGYLFVIRTNGNNSKPCSNCINIIDKYSYIITIKNIYYTHEEEESGIRKTTIKQLIDGPQHISQYQQNCIKPFSVTTATKQIYSVG